MMKSFGLTSQIRHQYPPPHRTLLLIVVPILVIIATFTIFIYLYGGWCLRKSICSQVLDALVWCTYFG
jgi:hypothetical protein